MSERSERMKRSEQSERSVSGGTPPILALGTLFRIYGIMADIQTPSAAPCGAAAQAPCLRGTSLVKSEGLIRHHCRIKTYIDGSMEIMAASRPIFREPGWESEDWAQPQDIVVPEQVQPQDVVAVDKSVENRDRAMRRARARVRDIALSNRFRWFVTLTLDGSKVDRYDMQQITRKFNNWCTNRVQQNGLIYVLVPERHKDGAIHFHGFMAGDLPAVDSGHKDKAGRTIYNLPSWTLGYTTAVEITGDYHAAVGYCCKYIGKQGEKPGGRWYYSGGKLNAPRVEYAEITASELSENAGVHAFHVPCATVAMVRTPAPLSIENPN